MLLQRLSAFILSSLFLALPASAQERSYSLRMEAVSLSLHHQNDGSLRYEVHYRDQPVVLPSPLGFTLAGGRELEKGFRIVGMDTSSYDQSWEPVWGEEQVIRDRHRQLTLRLLQEATGIRMDICFRVFAEGVAFRYIFPRQPALTYFVITAEKTGFRLTGDHTAFWIPGDYDTNEQPYTRSPLSKVDAWQSTMVSEGGREINVPDRYAVQTPLTMKTAAGLYLSMHEAALVDFPAMQLHVDREKYLLTANLVPDAIGNKAYLRTPAQSPWRTILISDRAAGLLESRMILNLNEPSRIRDASWIQPMKFAGVWWEMQTNKGSWNYTDHPDSSTADGRLIPNGRHSARTENVKRYIDFAAQSGIKGLLVEGWNTGWEAWYGNWYGRHFDFVTPYPDFDVQSIQAYAREKGVQMIMHNETSADAATYDQQMDTAFKFMNTYGYPAVKTGYVGRIIPRGEHHDGQWMINHYLRSIRKAAAHKVMIDIHEPVRPTGLHRTWPNFIASEAARGNEFNAFAEGSPPDHETILPFTRLLGGPMDYTPGIFKLRGYASADPGRQLKSTLAKQLALYVTLYSPLQMVADLPEHYAAHPDAFAFIREVPVDWQATRILEAEPGDYLTVARKQKGGEGWYVGAITDENSRVATVSLDYLDPGVTYAATIYADAASADWKTNPEAYTINSYLVNHKSLLKIKIAPGGGAAISIRPATPEQVKDLKFYR